MSRYVVQQFEMFNTIEHKIVDTKTNEVIKYFKTYDEAADEAIDLNNKSNQINPDDFKDALSYSYGRIRKAFDVSGLESVCAKQKKEFEETCVVPNRDRIPNFKESIDAEWADKSKVLPKNIVHVNEEKLRKIEVGDNLQFGDGSIKKVIDVNNTIDEEEDNLVPEPNEALRKAMHNHNQMYDISWQLREISEEAYKSITKDSDGNGDYIPQHIKEVVAGGLSGIIRSIPPDTRNEITTTKELNDKIRAIVYDTFKEIIGVPKTPITFRLFQSDIVNRVQRLLINTLYIEDFVFNLTSDMYKYSVFYTYGPKMLRYDIQRTIELNIDVNVLITLPNILKG